MREPAVARSRGRSIALAREGLRPAGRCADRAERASALQRHPGPPASRAPSCDALSAGAAPADRPASVQRSRGRSGEPTGTAPPRSDQPTLARPALSAEAPHQHADGARCPTSTHGPGHPPTCADADGRSLGRRHAAPQPAGRLRRRPPRGSGTGNTICARVRSATRALAWDPGRTAALARVTDCERSDVGTAKDVNRPGPARPCPFGASETPSPGEGRRRSGLTGAHGDARGGRERPTRLVRDAQLDRAPARRPPCDRAAALRRLRYCGRRGTGLWSTAEGEATVLRSAEVLERGNP